LKSAERHVYIDEIDKIFAQNPKIPPSRVMLGEGVQQALLKDYRRHECQCTSQGRTQASPAGILAGQYNQYLFICGGAFHGLEDIISNRLEKGHGIWRRCAAQERTIRWPDPDSGSALRIF